MATIIGIFIGGTTGLFDGTLSDSSHPIVLPDDDTPLQVHFRAIDETTLEDNQEDSTTTLSPSLPTGLLGCFTVDGNYVSSPTTGATIAHGGNQPLWVKRDGNPAPDFYDLTIGAELFEAGTRVAAPSITLTPGAASITATWSAVTDADGYEVQYKLDADSTWTQHTADTTSPVTISGLTNGTAYDVRVRAFSELGVGDYDEDTATAGVFEFGGSGAFPDFFTGRDASTSGTAVLNGSGQLEVSSPATTDGVLMYRTAAVGATTTRTYKLKVKAQQSTPTFTKQLVVMLANVATQEQPSAFNAGAGDWINSNRGPLLSVDFRDTSGLRANLTYVAATTFTAYQWNSTASEWQTPATNTLGPTLDWDTYYVVILEVHATNGYRLTLKNADESSTITQTAWVTAATLADFTAGCYLCWGDPWTDVHSGKCTYEWYAEVD